MTAPTPDFSPEAIDAAASVMYDRVKTVPTLTFAIAYPSEQEDFRRVARGMVAAYLSASGLLAALEAAQKERKEWADLYCLAVEEGQKVLDGLHKAERDAVTTQTHLSVAEAALEAKDGEVERLRAVEKAARRLEQMGPAHRLDPVPDDIKATIRASNAHESHTPRSENCWHCQGGWDTPIEPGGTTTWADRYHEQGDAWTDLRAALAPSTPKDAP